MKRFGTPSIALSFILLIFLNGCKKKDEPEPIKVGDLYYKSGSNFLETTQLNSLQSITINKLIFTKNDFTRNLNVNEILVIGVSDKTPYGALRKIVSKTENSGKIEITTTNARLNDILISGRISLNTRLLQQDFTVNYAAEGVLTNNQGKSFEGVSITLKDMDIASGALVNKADGSIGLSPEINFIIDFEASVIKELSSSAKMTQVHELTYSTNAAYSGTEEVRLGEFIHNPIILDKLVFVPVITFNCSTSGSISPSGSFGVRQDRIISSTLDYSKIPQLSSALTYKDFKILKLPNISNIKVISGARMDIYLFGEIIFSINSNNYFELIANPDWKFKIGSTGKNIIRGNMFGLSKDLETDLNIESLELGGGKRKGASY